MLSCLPNVHRAGTRTAVPRSFLYLRGRFQIARAKKERAKADIQEFPRRSVAVEFLLPRHKLIGAQTPSGG